jgi:hypothetical protein
MAFPPGQTTRIFEKNVSTLKGFVNRTKTEQKPLPPGRAMPEIQ